MAPTIWNLSRRDFVKASAGAGATLVLGVSLQGCRTGATAGKVSGGFSPNAFLRIDSNGETTIVVGRSEMGQGVLTSIPMLIADELGADWSKLRYESAPADAAFNNPAFGIQATGGSTSVRAHWDGLRKAGAAARMMLVAAAASEWGVTPADCTAENGEVIHQASNRRAPFGTLVGAAAKLKVPTDPVLRDPKQYRFIGKAVNRLDTPSKVDGTAEFGIDVKVPGLLVAVVQRCPVFGGKVTSFDAAKAKAVPGVRHVVQISSGVAVVADGYWPATQGRKALEVTWDEGPDAATDSAAIAAKFRELAQQPGVVARHDGDAPATIGAAARKVEATYEVPYLAHACMEPMNCTAHARADGCDIWGPTQNQTGSQAAAAQLLGMPKESVKVHTTMLGGGFGRRFEVDFVTEAVETSKAVGAPVKVVWSREDDIQHCMYRPATFNQLKAGLDRSGRLEGWSHHIVGPSIMSRFVAQFGPLKNGVDDSSVEGAANIPYAVPNIQVSWVRADVSVPVGFWRSVGSSQNAFITESFVDELAVAAGKDPYEFRRSLLDKSPRHLGVLQLAAEKAGWSDKRMPAGRGRGIAVAESFGSFVAEVAEVTVRNGVVRVDRVVCAVDCGIAVNPGIIEAQMQSAIVYGLTAALRGEISIERGRVKQSNFHDYQMLRINEMPVVEVHILPSTQALGGAGEPGTPPIAPAVCNAIYAATGKRIRRLPIGGQLT